MTKNITLVAFLLLAKSLFGQITTTKVATKAVVIDVTKYDSTKNFLAKDAHKYIGQELYVIGLSESLRHYGYKGFLLNYRESELEKGNIYECDNLYSSKYESISGKYYKVLDVVLPSTNEVITENDSYYFIKIQEKGTDNILYYKYSANDEYSFPFLVVGYFEKFKKKMLNSEFVLRGRNWEDSNPEMRDIVTGRPVDYSAGTVWKCVDLTIEEKFYTLSMIFQNSKGEKLAYSVDNYNKGNYFAFSKILSDRCKVKFKPENWSLILAGKVKLGMTSAMCRYSWDEPKSINTTIIAGKKQEQWVYADGYLYLDNGILTGIQ